MRIIYGEVTLDLRKVTRLSALLKFYMLTETKEVSGSRKNSGKTFLETDVCRYRAGL